MLIKHYFLRGKPLSKTMAKLDKYYPDSARLYRMVQKWFTEFRCGFTSTETISSPGPPNTPEMINKINDIVLNLCFYLWGYAKSKCFVDKPATIEALEANIAEVISEIPTEVFERVIQNWCLRMDELKRSCCQHLKGVIFKK